MLSENKRLLFCNTLWDGKRVGDAVRASLWSREAQHVRDIHAEIVGDPQRHLAPPDLVVRVRSAAPESHRANGNDRRGGGGVRGVDDPAAIRLLHELPHPKVPAGTEQDHGHGLHRRGGASGAHSAQLGTDAESWVGAGWRGGGVERVVVVHSGGSNGLY